jgi:hypothetical protein
MVSLRRDAGALALSFILPDVFLAFSQSSSAAAATPRRK